MNNTFTLQALDAQIAARHLLTHPFYQEWTQGTLQPDALRDYARQYYHHVAAFPTYLSAVHARTNDQHTRRVLLANLVDEEAGEPNHPELWLRFAQSLGMTREDAQSAAPWDTTEQLIATFRDVCQHESTAAGLAALYAYESQIPAVSASKIDGLQKFYGFTCEEGYRYFTVHIEADREHAAAERALLASHLDSDKGPEAQAAAGRVLDALWSMLDGVCQRHNIPC